MSHTKLGQELVIVLYRCYLVLDQGRPIYSNLNDKVCEEMHGDGF